MVDLLFVGSFCCGLFSDCFGLFCLLACLLGCNLVVLFWVVVVIWFCLLCCPFDFVWFVGFVNFFSICWV